ncbi:hypothetical protein Scep_024691 [Stephania cephalantha]|uniref:Uncharacterized protein n=1 Tax=Stephania cephalantha TaxID=152367 RepID=A0AAP0EYB2_9MAGN
MVSAFVHERKNTTLMKASVTSAGTEAGFELGELVGADLKKKSGLPLEIEMDTKVHVKIGSLKAKKVGIRVSCNGIQAAIQKGKGKSAVSDYGSFSNASVRWIFGSRYGNGLYDRSINQYYEGIH